MDWVKLLTRGAIRAVVLLALIIFIVNGFLAGMLPAWVASIPVELTLPIFIAMLIAVIAEDWIEKSFLRKYM